MAANEIIRIAIIGGGPGGMFSAWALENKLGTAAEITIYEASNRLGGKLLTGEFPGYGPYEAGVAEIYDYSNLGPDPLKELIVEELGLPIKAMDGNSCLLDGNAIYGLDDLSRHFGQDVADAVDGFRTLCAGQLSPADYYASRNEVDNDHPWRALTGISLIQHEVKHEMARRYLRAMAHSDVAAPFHLTDGLTLLKNVLMDVDGYLDIFGVVGGNDLIIDQLEEQLDAQIELNSPVMAVNDGPDGEFLLHIAGRSQPVAADIVIAALPLASLSTVNWHSTKLQAALDRHVSHFDRPGHYLRVTLLFQHPFWRDVFDEDWWMLDAFDGCCVYDEGRRNVHENGGMLAFLIAGNAALALANASDEHIEHLCLAALSPKFSMARELLLDRRVHRWMASVNAIPGGTVARPRYLNQQPDPQSLPGLIMVGDYMFDATLNGVMDSADTASDLILRQVLARRSTAAALPTSAALDALLPVETLAKLMRQVWALPARVVVLLCGEISEAMQQRWEVTGFDIHVARHGKIPDPGSIICDVIVDLALANLPSHEIGQHIAGYRRVAGKGVLLASPTLDLKLPAIEEFGLANVFPSLRSRWDWAELMLTQGLTHSITDTGALDAQFEMVQQAGSDALRWFEDKSSLFYSFFDVPKSSLREKSTVKKPIEEFRREPV